MDAEKIINNLAWDESGSDWSSKFELPNGKRASVSVEADEQSGVSDEQKNTVRDFFAREPEIRRRLAEPMSEEYNGGWNEGDEATWKNGAQITPEELADEIYLESVSIREDGSAMLFYHDNNLMGGHVITATLKTNDELDDPRLEG